MRQPPLSQSIRALEAELGVQLLERTSRQRHRDAGRRGVRRGGAHRPRERRPGGGGDPAHGWRRSRSPDRLHPASPHRAVAVVPRRAARARRGCTFRGDPAARYGAGPPSCAAAPWTSGSSSSPSSTAASRPPRSLRVSRSSLPCAGSPARRVRCARPRAARSEVLIDVRARGQPRDLRRVHGRARRSRLPVPRRPRDLRHHPRDLLLPVSRNGGVLLAPQSLQHIDEIGTLVIARPLDPALTTADRVIAWRADPPRELSRVLAAVREAVLEPAAVSARAQAATGSLPCWRSSIAHT